MLGKAPYFWAAGQLMYLSIFTLVVLNLQLYSIPHFYFFVVNVCWIYELSDQTKKNELSDQIKKRGGVIWEGKLNQIITSIDEFEDSKDNQKRNKKYEYWGFGSETHQSSTS